MPSPASPTTTPHRITGWHDSNDTEFRYVYDASGRVVETQGTDGILTSRIAYAGPEHDGITTATYTDSLGHATTYRANPHGQIVSITDTLGHTVHHQWDARDRLLSSTDPAGHTTRWEWSMWRFHVASPDRGRGRRSVARRPGRAARAGRP
ncbi:RHS repeat domain-containing protein [Streptomyces sp. NPDC046821]|uniref:RHS repeat domain-containing protein n=1 Tax=Streptomyces sp. NPDC046821 TaxID=3154702 RepID=UPI0033C86084